MSCQSLIHLIVRELGEGADVVGSTALCGEGERWLRCRGDEGVSALCRWPALETAAEGALAWLTFAPTFKLALRLVDALSLRFVRAFVPPLAPLRPIPRNGADSKAPELHRPVP